MLHNKGYFIVGGKLISKYGNGICYCHTVNPGTDIEEPHAVDGDSWCPDYCNREKTNKKEKLTLDDWLTKIKEK